MTEPNRIDRRIATITTVVLLVLGSGIFLAGAISAADTLLGAGPGDRALSRESAVLAVQVVREPNEGSTTSDRQGDRHAAHMESHYKHPGAPMEARVTLERGDASRTFVTNDRGFIHLDLRANTYTLGIETRLGSDSTELDVHGITHVLAQVADDGTMTFTVENHDQHHPPFRPPRHHDASHGGTASGHQVHDPPK